jgi:preprotein translocase subunit SecE
LATETIEQTGDGTRGGPLGWWHRTGDFFAEVRGEMRRVTWPARREVYATTVVVILVSVFFGLYLFGVDLLFSAGVQWLLRRMGAGGV